MKHDALKNAFDKHKRFKHKAQMYRKKPLQSATTPDVPKGLYEKCQTCNKTFIASDIADNNFVCPSCDNHFRLRAIDRINITVDRHSFLEKGHGFITLNPLFIDGYEQKIADYKEQTGLDEAYVYGYAQIKGVPFVIGVMDSHFMMGSMGSVVGEKVTKSIEYALVKRLPLILFVASGGARMQEGIFSLMQMAKTSGALKKLHEQGLLFVSVLTHPTTGGVTASFASLGDIILAEPKALIGFAGPRVIKQTIKQDLPEGFQRAEFLQDKGMIDKVVHRNELRDTLYKVLKLHKGVGA